LLHLLAPDALWPWVGFAGAFAAANADTWATELGVLSRSAPRLITTGKPAERGTSGAISGTGILAAFCGSLVVALLAVLFWQGRVTGLPVNSPEWIVRLFGAEQPTLSTAQGLLWALGITISGLLGSLVDSLLGATVQAIYYCPTCQKETERHPLHLCGAPTTLIRGLPWMDNDWVNTICTLAGGVIASIIALI
jgi:uncharacterized membrane protein